MTDLLLGARAQANHPSEDDPSLWVASLAELATGDVTSTFGPIDFEANSYCGFHWLLARGDEGTELEGVSLQIDAEWTSPSGDEGVLAVSTSWSDGRLMPWDALHEVVVGAGDGLHLEVEVERDAGRLFDDVEFATATAAEVDWLLLENLLDHARVTVVASPR